MAGGQTFLKRQKERARQEKQQLKAQKRLEKRQAEPNPAAESTDTTERPNGPVITLDEDGQPQGLDFHDF